MMPEQQQQDLPGYYPIDEEFGYSVRHHKWLLNGRVLSEEESTIIWNQKDKIRRAAYLRQQERELAAKIAQENSRY